MSDSRAETSAAPPAGSLEAYRIIVSSVLEDSDEEFTRIVTEMLEEKIFPPEGLLLPLTLHAAESVRRRAVFLLSQVGGERSVQAICGRLTDSSPVVRASAVSSLGRIRAKAAVGPLLALFAGGGDPQVCKAAAEALGKIGDPAAVPVLEEVTRTFPGYAVRSACQMAIRQIGSGRRSVELPGNQEAAG